jgi:hypothetical protein
MLREIYSILQSARESVAGCQVQDLPVSIERVVNARMFMSNILEHFGEDKTASFHGYATFLGWKHKVAAAERLLKQAKNYGDRLGPDRMLCDVLNEMLKELE